MVFLGAALVLLCGAFSVHAANGTLQIKEWAYDGPAATFHFSVTGPTAYTTDVAVDAYGPPNYSWMIGFSSIQSVTPGTYAIHEILPRTEGWNILTSRECYWWDGSSGGNTGINDTDGMININVIADRDIICEFRHYYTGNPVPLTTSITPTEKLSNDPPFTLTVNGSNFTSSSIIYLGNLALPTNHVSASQLTASISSMPAVGTHTVSIANPAPGGGTSNSQTFTVTQAPENPTTNPVPFISSISPTIMLEGVQTITVTGTNFVPSSVVHIITGASNQAFSTTYISSTQLSVLLSLGSGYRTLNVVNPAPGGGTSNEKGFVVNPPSGPLSITSISPTSVPAGSPAFTMTVNGTGFSENSILLTHLNGTFANPVVTYSPTQITFLINASALVVPTTYFLKVSSNGQISNTIEFTVGQPLSQEGSLSIMKNTIGGIGTFAFTGNTGITSISTVIYQTGQPGTGTQSVTLAPGTYAISETPQAGWTLTSSSCTNGTPSSITIIAGQTTICFFTNSYNIPTNPTPTITTISPVSAPVLLTPLPQNIIVNGTNFISSSVVHFGAVTLSTTYVSPTQLTATIPATELDTPGTRDVTVVNPAPGGGTSNANTFTITPLAIQYGSIRVTKNTTGGNGTFSFTSTAGNFQITTVNNTGIGTINNVPPGSYTVAESTQAGWQQTQTNCTNITVTASQTTSCTFSNNKIQSGGGGGGLNNTWIYVGIVPIIIAMVVVLALMPK